MRSLVGIFLALCLCNAGSNAWGGTFDIGVGEFPRHFASAAPDVVGIVDSTGGVIVGTIFASGPIDLEFTPTLFRLSARTIEMAAETSIRFQGQLEFSLTNGIAGLGQGPLPTRQPVVVTGSASFVPNPGTITLIGGATGNSSWQSFAIPVEFSGSFVIGSGGSVLNVASASDAPPIIGLLVPVPEPSVAILMLAGLATVGVETLRRRRSSSRSR